MKIAIVIIALSLFAELALASDSQTIFVKRNNGVISNAEFDAWMSKIPAEDRMQFLSDKNRLEKLLGQLLTNAQMAADAREAGFDQDENVKLRMHLSAEAELAQAWTRHKIMTESSPDIDALAYEAYLSSPADFMTERAIDVTHLLVSTEERSEEEALAIVRDLRSQLEPDPSLFEELILKHSDDTSAAENNGNYGHVEKGDMVKPFEDRAFSLQINEISEPVKTNYGYHLIRLNKVHKSELMSFDLVKDGLMLKVKKQHEDRVKIDYLNSIGSYETELSEESLNNMLDRNMPNFESVGEPVVEQQ
jgi:peptidyl-prolyl cis-trans isomerase C